MEKLNVLLIITIYTESPNCNTDKRIFEVKKNFVTSRKREAAVAYLMTQLHPETLSTGHDFMYSEAWPHQFHLGFGTEVRNLLRAKFDWDDHLLDAEIASSQIDQGD